MRANQACFSIVKMARVLGVSPSGFHAWRDRDPSQRAVTDDYLTVCIRNIVRRSPIAVEQNGRLVA